LTVKVFEEIIESYLKSLAAKHKELQRDIENDKKIKTLLLKLSPIKYEDNSFTFIHSSIYSFFITVQIIKELERLSSFLNNRK